jgi:hypothetical protein
VLITFTSNDKSPPLAHAFNGMQHPGRWAQLCLKEGVLAASSVYDDVPVLVSLRCVPVQRRWWLQPDKPPEERAKPQ